AFVLAFFMSGGGFALPDLRGVNFCRPGKAQPPPGNVLNRLKQQKKNPVNYKKNKLPNNNKKFKNTLSPEQ
ncbi:hypothetical protein, partial [Enterobacter intestinihominis]